MPCQLLLLAAGQGQRFGTDKRLAPLPSGYSLLASTIARYLALERDLVIALAGSQGHIQKQIEAELTSITGSPGNATRCHWLMVPEAASGMGHTLSGALKRWPLSADTGLLIGLGDMPFIAPETLIALRDRLEQQSVDALVRPRFLNRPGQPVGFGAAYRPALATLTGDAGARDLLATQTDRIDWLTVSDPGVLQDVDRPDDLTAS